MSLSRRYEPSWSPGESCNVGMEFSALIPPGVGIASGALAVFTNVAVPAASSDFTIGPIQIAGRAVYASLSGGKDGIDYQLRWQVIDTDGNVWPRTALMLCSLTS